MLCKMASNRHTERKNHVSGQISMWQKRADDHVENQKINPFSDWWGPDSKLAFDKNDPRYGTPIEGSMTESRGKRALKHISEEIVELCHIIADLGDPQPDGQYIITFGRLFSAYTRISDKVVGLLLRARKHGMVDFEGEMLYQGRDEEVIITCLRVPDWKEIDLVAGIGNINCMK